MMCPSKDSATCTVALHTFLLAKSILSGNIASCHLQWGGWTRSERKPKVEFPSLSLDSIDNTMPFCTSSPITIQEKIRKNWQKQVNNFIWNGKKTRIRFKVLQRGKKGRTHKLYYQAACLVWLSHWINNPNDKLMKFESADLPEVLHNLWVKKRLQTQFKNHVFRETGDEWFTGRDLFREGFLLFSMASGHAPDTRVWMGIWRVVRSQPQDMARRDRQPASVPRPPPGTAKGAIWPLPLCL